MRFVLAKKIRLYPFWEPHETPTPDYFGDVKAYRFDTSRLNVAYVLGPNAKVVSSIKLVGAIVVQSIDGRGLPIQIIEKRVGKLLRDPSIQGVIVNNFKIIEEGTTFFLKDYAWYCVDLPSVMLADHVISTSNRAEHVDVTGDTESEGADEDEEDTSAEDAGDTEEEDTAAEDDGEKKDADPKAKKAKDDKDSGGDDSADGADADGDADKKGDKAKKPKASKSDKPVKELPPRVKKLDKTAVNDIFVYRGLSNLLGFDLNKQTVKELQYKLDDGALSLWFQEREYIVKPDELRALRLMPDTLVIWLSFRGATQHEKSDKVSK